MSPLPIAVDLDGSLIRTDVIAAALRAHPQALWRALPAFFRRGRAGFKAKLAQLAPIDVAALPYRTSLIAALRAEREAGRRIVLATAADRVIAEAISAHLVLFDAVFASDGARNLKGARKAAALTAAFPEGFVYVGDSYADLFVWAKAKAAWLAGRRPFLRQLAPRLEREFAD